MILDPNGLADALGGAHRERADEQTEESAEVALSNETRLIVFRGSGSDVKAAPLELVTRLEEIEVSRLESADGRRVVQFRGELMPVMHIAGEHAYRDEGRQPVLVFVHEGATFGLAVNEIVDIVEAQLAIDLTADRPGVLGVAIIKGAATEIIDVGHYLSMFRDDWRPKLRGALPKASVLLVEPSAFSRGLLTPLLQAAGYSVTVAATPADARALAARGARFDVVLADLDSDPAAAAAFAEELASDPAWARSRPMAISREPGAPVGGFLERLSKTDRTGLLSALDYVLRSRELAA
jgi:two-component system chemotaxis sensor kinase CheA